MKINSFFKNTNCYVCFGFDFVVWFLFTLGLPPEHIFFKTWFHLTFSPKKYARSLFETLGLW